MGYAENVRQGTIEILLKTLKSETKPKQIERIIKALMKYGLTQEDIDARLSAIEETPKINTPPQNKGYKSGNFLSGDQMYVLACTHQIRAKKQVGIFSKGMVGKTVWCDVCNANREVTAMPYWVK